MLPDDRRWETTRVVIIAAVVAVVVTLLVIVWVTGVFVGELGGGDPDVTFPRIAEDLDQ